MFEDRCTVLRAPEIFHNSSDSVAKERLPRESSFECIELLSIQPRDPVARGRVEGGEGRVEGGRMSYEGGRGCT